MRYLILFLMLLVLTGCARSTAPAVKTQVQLGQELDEAIARLNWAQVDYWKAGGRDILVSVQLDTSLAPNYFRLPRKSVP